MDKETGRFQYTYSASRQEEIESIRRRYLPDAPESKLETLRRLDHSVDRKGRIVSMAVGICGCLLMGVGMCCSMVWIGSWFVPGIVMGVLGIVGVAMAYPVYTHVTKKERKRLAPQILQLSQELTG